MMIERGMKKFPGFMNETTKFFLEQVKDVCIIVKMLSSKEVYDGRLARIFV